MAALGRTLCRFRSLGASRRAIVLLRANQCSQLRLSLLRQISTAPQLCCPGTKENEMDSQSVRDSHHPTDFEKKMLVWAKSYKSVEEVPEKVSLAQLHRAKDYFRIRINMFMCGATMMGCVIMIWSGRRARNSGESLNKMGLQHQQQLQEQGRREKEEATRKAESK